MSPSKALYSQLPSVSRLLQAPELQALVAQAGEGPVKRQIRDELEQLRQGLERGDAALAERVSDPGFFAQLLQGIRLDVERSTRQSLLPVINLTGTVIHTNLGRSRLPEAAISALLRVADTPCNLEYDLQRGQRGQRDSHLEPLLCELTGAEAATVVNNNAAAVVLVLNTLCRQREAVISRGELVEIGGSFRMPDVMSSANSILREVGTTNRTHLRDYADAISDDTGVIMKVHTSNYEIQGYTNSVDEATLAALARDKGVPFVSDLGSGSLVDMRQYGLPHEPTVASVLAAGADV
ncbi:MAG: L-seryl-tRNA(Sec) selenium transferase, partial [Pseudohongiellaceae bacterium]